MAAVFSFKELTTWSNEILRERGERPITDLRKRISDGVTLVTLLEILGKSLHIVSYNYNH